MAVSPDRAFADPLQTGRAARRLPGCDIVHLRSDINQLDRGHWSGTSYPSIPATQRTCEHYCFGSKNHPNTIIFKTPGRFRSPSYLQHRGRVSTTAVGLRMLAASRFWGHIDAGIEAQLTSPLI